MKIIFTGGGTAGHVTPNIALMGRLMKEGWEISYIGSKNGIEKDLIGKIPGVKYYGISSGKLRRYFDMKNFSDPFRVMAGFSQAKRIIRKEKPDVIFSKGGFVTVPVVAAAGRVPVVIHESDYTPGLANRLASRFADTICVTFSDTVSKIKHKGKHIVHTGTPIRPELYNGSEERAKAFTGFSGEKPVLLVMGGSSGAQRLNELLREALPKLTMQFDIIHLCGRGKLEPEAECEGYRQYEYINEELPDLLALSDIILSRAGANAIFEFLALTKPALLVPLPLSASRGDQILNAHYFVNKGYADMLDQDTATADSLAQAIARLYENRLICHANMVRDSMLDGTDEVLDQIRMAAGLYEKEEEEHPEERPVVDLPEDPLHEEEAEEEQAGEEENVDA